MKNQILLLLVFIHAIALCAQVPTDTLRTTMLISPKDKPGALHIWIGHQPGLYSEQQCVRQKFGESGKLHLCIQSRNV